MIILRRGFSRIDSRCQGEALRPGAAGAAIATIPIASTFLIVPASSLSLGRLGAMRKHGLCLVRAEQKGFLVPGLIFGRF